MAAVSGGPDSTALFILLADLRDSTRAEFPELLAGHIHHGLRGRDADLDEECARSLAASRAAPFLVHRGDARAEADRRRLSPEAGARALRLAAFLEWSRSAEIDAIALAHHLDDVAETVLLRAARGAGIRGIRGIPGDRTLLRGGGSSVLLVRPLLEARREDLARFLEERSLAYRMDRTNLDPTVPRNRVRLEVLPALEAAHPGAAGNIARFARIARGWARDLEVLGRRAYRDALRPSREEGAVELDAARLRTSPPSVLHESLRIAIEEARRAAGVEEDIPAASSLDARASASLRGWIVHPARGPATLRIRGGMEIELRYGRVRIRRASDPGASGSRGPVPAPVVLGAGAGELRWGAWRFIARYLAPGEAPARPGSPERHRESLDAEKLEAAGALLVRARRRGESFHPLGAPGSKALKEFLRERRVRPDERDAVPLVAAGDSITWVVGHRIAHPFRITEATRRVLEIEAWREG